MERGAWGCGERRRECGRGRAGGPCGNVTGLFYILEHMVRGTEHTEHGLSPYEKRLWIEVDRILYQNYFTPRVVTDFWREDRDAIVAHLKQMKDRVIRSIVVIRYVEVDDVLNRTIVEHFFRIRGARRGKKYATLHAMLDKMYPQQKLDAIKVFKEVPREVSSHIMALNDLRNSFAHKFDLSRVPKSRRLYKGKYDVFTKKGLEKFSADMWEVDEFFQPEIMNITLALVKRQRELNKASARRR